MATSFNASSKLNTPAIQALTNSPILCPIVATGFIPQLISNIDNEYSIVKIAGCVKNVFFKDSKKVNE